MAKIDIIIPTHNREHTIKRAVQSVLNQTFSDFSLWVVDDGSSECDHTTAELASISDSRLRLLRLSENQGVSKARNHAIKQGCAEWVAFLDSDDEWLKDKLDKQILFSQTNPHINIIHGEEIWIRNGVRVNQMKKHQKFGGWIFQKCLPLCVISPSAVMIKRETLDELGCFDENFPVCEDYDLWLRLTSRYEVGFISDPLIIKYGGHEDQLSRRFVAMDYWRIKAMDKILKEKVLSLGDEEALKKELLRKTQILLSGYKKHNNLEHYDEINDILSRYSLFS